jgi:alpha-1,3-rhamnosyl/mannosyltransferase
MSHGAPVVCSDLPVLREVGAEAAEYAEAGSADDLAAAIERLLFDRALRAERTRAGEERAAQFSWEKSASKFEGVLVSAAANSLSWGGRSLE